ncbi:MAG: transporter [Gallionellaceae bacterium]|nr:MAG: transporter [Gallionellaceae bacterium]
MRLKKTALKCSMGMALAAMSGVAAASGFALIEQGVGGLGNAYAGGAAIAEDATTVFYNPAGMNRLSGTQLTLAAQGIQPSAKFSDGGSAGAALQTQGGVGGDAGSMAVVPNAYFVAELDPKLRLGLGINSPFGLQTSYDPTWMGRFQAIKSSIQTVNLNPAVSCQITDAVSVGAGVSYQRITGELSGAVNYSAAAFAADPVGNTVLTAIGGAGKEGVSTVSGNDNSYGYNLGALINLGSQTRVGLAYRSPVKHTLTGTVTFTNVPTALATSPKLANGGVTLDVSMPDTFSTSVVHQLGPQFDLMADVTWTGWGSFQNLDVVRSNGSALSSTPENWKNTWRVAAGATHRYSDQWTSRFGVAYDQTPVSDTYRTARIPDQDRTWLALGGQYKLAKGSSIDFGYAHLFVKSSSISQNQSATGGGNLVGSYANSVNIYSLQYGHSF